MLLNRNSDSSQPNILLSYPIFGAGFPLPFATTTIKYGARSTEKTSDKLNWKKDTRNMVNFKAFY